LIKKREEIYVIKNINLIEDKVEKKKKKIDHFDFEMMEGIKEKSNLTQLPFLHYVFKNHKSQRIYSDNCRINQPFQSNQIKSTISICENIKLI